MKRLLSNWKAPQTNNYVRHHARSDRVAFIQSSGTSDGDKTKAAAVKQNKTNSKGESHCYDCRDNDHWSSECPHDKMMDDQRAELAGNKGEMLMNVQREMEEHDEVSLLNVMLLNRKNVLSDDRLYLDNCYTVTAVKNKSFLKNLKDADQHLSVSCNTGVVKANQLGDLGEMESYSTCQIA